MKQQLKEKGITMIALVITVVILIILAGVTIDSLLGDNGIIKEAKQTTENYELAQIKEKDNMNSIYTELVTQLGSLDSGSDSEDSSGSGDSAAELLAFKVAIADYIEEAGGVRPDDDASASTFGEKIKGILAEATKNATATEDNLSEGVTAYVNGQLITGNGSDNNTYYQNGYNAGKAYVGISGLTVIDSVINKEYTTTLEYTPEEDCYILVVMSVGAISGYNGLSIYPTFSGYNSMTEIGNSSASYIAKVQLTANTTFTANSIHQGTGQTHSIFFISL